MKFIGPCYAAIALVVMGISIYHHPDQLTPGVTLFCFAGGIAIGVMCSVMFMLANEIDQRSA